MNGFTQEFEMGGIRVKMSVEGNTIAMYNLTDGRHVLDMNTSHQLLNVYSVNGLIETVKCGSAIRHDHL